MDSYLDSHGLETLWGDIGETFATKDVATQSANGLMSSADKTKLDGIKVDNDTIKVNSDGEMYVDIPSLMGVSY